MTWKLDDPRARRARGRCAKSQEVLEAMKERAAKLSELEAGRKRRAPVKHLQMDVEPAKLKHRKQTAGCQLVVCAPSQRARVWAFPVFFRFSEFSRDIYTLLFRFVVIIACRMRPVRWFITGSPTETAIHVATWKISSYGTWRDVPRGRSYWPFLYAPRHSCSCTGDI